MGDRESKVHTSATAIKSMNYTAGLIGKLLGHRVLIGEFPLKRPFRAKNHVD